MNLSLKVLGGFAVHDGSGAALSLPTRKTRALLGYLAVHANQPQPREKLTALLWSESGDKQARHSLNQSLLAIRKLGLDAGLTLLDTDGDNVRLVGDAIETDAVCLRSLLGKNPSEAGALYRGPLLEGLSIPDPGFEEWLTAARSELHGLACKALEKAATDAARQGRTEAAVETATKLVSLDPLREEGHRLLMRLQHEAGNRAGALRQYQACADVLKKELQIEPNAATRALFEKFRCDTRSKEESEPPQASPGTSPPLPDKPSIAVMSFDNLGGDSAQDFFGDGMAEDIITELSRFHSLFVIARGSSFSFKGQSLDTRQIARELGVRYVLEGSVRTHGSRIRVTAQLIDAKSGHHIWSERYDRETEDIFAVQDDMTERIVGIIEPEIVLVEQTNAERQAPDRLEVWGLYQQAVSRYYKMTAEDRTAGIALLHEAISRDSGFAPAHAYLAIYIQNGVTFGDYDNPDAALSEALEAAQESMRLDARDALSPYALGRVFTALGKLHNSHQHLATATDHLRTAIDLNPNFALAYYGLGNALYFSERPAEAIESIATAMRLNPNAPNLWAMCKGQALSYASLNQDRIALEWAQKAMQQPNAHARFNAALAAIAAQLGESDQVEAAVSELRQHLSETEIAQAISVCLRLYSPKEKFKEGFGKAGLLEP